VTKTPQPAGIAFVDKAPGWTSHDVVAKSRGLLGTRKIGHSGTLDPAATGLLILGVGRATRLLTFLSGLDKTYTGEAVLGRATSTLDDEGEVTGEWDMGAVTLADAQAAAATLTGTIRQVPPMVSAKKVGGQRLHELARKGVEVEREPVRVHVGRFDVTEAGESGVFQVAVQCSSGTYVRSLVADLGTALGGGAHLRRLRRHGIGPFSVDEAVPLEDLTPEAVHPPLEAFRGRTAVQVTGDRAVQVRHGQVMAAADLGVDVDDHGDSGPLPVVDEAGRLIAVYVRYRERGVKPAVVLG
jgi:tRNA pseudouridine55 synthase